MNKQPEQPTPPAEPAEMAHADWTITDDPTYWLWCKDGRVTRVPKRPPSSAAQWLAGEIDASWREVNKQ